MPLGFESHDHDACIAGAVATADRYCLDNKLQLTPVRRKVLEILLSGHRAMGAYDILEDLRASGFASQPPVAYRALDFLVSHGFVHRLEKLNAFIACAHPGTKHAPAFMICSRCGAVAEASAEPSRGQLGQAAKAAGFRIEAAVLEAEGTCPRCLADTSTENGGTT